ncbi:A24 family peptidase [Arhodomonas sp. KWT2]|uniref:prepilin peptidase n=1 Tax=unclassified Arhodomonas TaxID=2621637 RepID=UPI0013D69C69|nr:A24 family peptidase [Arhodomonas sp. KWT]
MPALEFLAASPGLQGALVVLVGLAVGSFLNVVTLRVPRMLEADWAAQCAELRGETPPGREPFNLMRPGSHCPACGAPILARDNIPVLGWLLLRGRCRDCGTRISPRYPIVEGATAVLSLVTWWQLGWTAAGAAGLVLTWWLIVLTVIDLDHFLLPDNLTLPGLWLGLLLALVPVFVGPATAIAGAAAGYLVLWAVYHAFRLITGKEGMGYGDFKLLALLGAWLGWQMLPLVIIVSSFVGAAVGIALIAGLGRHRDQPIPFGPYLAAAGWVALLWGDTLIDAYLQFAGIT